jgi:hypothetical protein
VPAASAASCDETSAGELFEQRIAPLLAEDRPSTCNQCHLSGFDLDDFVRDDACETMACLVEDGLVNLDVPDQSTILTWIRRAEPDTERVTEAVIEQEYDGFLQWIEFTARCGETACPDAACGPRDEASDCPPSAPTDPEVAPLGELSCEGDALETLFYTNVFAWRNRCAPCHVDTTAAATAGQPSPWIRTSGSCAEASRLTLGEVEQRGLLNLTDPVQSLLVQKPLADRVTHGGSEKFHDTNDNTYKQFMVFIEQYAKCNAP